jgi:hypothetical protein
MSCSVLIFHGLYMSRLFLKFNCHLQPTFWQLFRFNSATLPLDKLLRKSPF